VICQLTKSKSFVTQQGFARWLPIEQLEADMLLLASTEARWAEARRLLLLLWESKGGTTVSPVVKEKVGRALAVWESLQRAESLEDRARWVKQLLCLGLPPLLSSLVEVPMGAAASRAAPTDDTLDPS
jgi:hypothetical protein